MKYNYVVLGSSWDLYKQSYSDLANVDYAEYLADYFSNVNNILKQFLLKINLSSKYNNIFPIPFKEYCFSQFLGHEFPVNKPRCFIFFRNWLRLENFGFSDYLRKTYPNCKLVLFRQDLVHVEGNDYIKEEEERVLCNKIFDLILSFDQEDCIKYNYVYHPLVFSSYHGEVENLPKSDVYFLGLVKNRYKEIVKCFERLWENDVVVDANLVGVPISQRVYPDKINYIDGMDYKTNIQHVLNSNCELEIMQVGGHGYTQRMCEVISLDKKLLTNNPIVNTAPFYNPDYIFQINDYRDIDKDICSMIKKRDKVDYKYKENLSPIELIHFIEKHL